MKYNGQTYHYIKNLMGDILGIMDENSTLLVTYEYDPWGNLIAMEDNSGIGLGEQNPFRYRGYYYDGETGFYYLQSRYYDPEIGRWINADSVKAPA